MRSNSAAGPSAAADGMEMETEGGGGGGGGGDEFYSTKYLTNSRLLGLQLADPTMRRQLLVQLLMHLEQLGAEGVKLARRLTNRHTPATIKSYEDFFRKKV